MRILRELGFMIWGLRTPPPRTLQDFSLARSALIISERSGPATQRH